MSVSDQIEDLCKIAQKTLNLIAEMKWKDGLKRVEAYCKNIFSMKDPNEIVTFIDKSFNFFVEIQTDATQHFDLEKLCDYMKFLTEEQGIDECLQFFNYAMGLKCQFLSVLVFYHSYKDEQDQVNARLHQLVTKNPFVFV